MKAREARELAEKSPSGEVGGIIKRIQKTAAEGHFSIVAQINDDTAEHLRVLGYDVLWLPIGFSDYKISWRDAI